MTLSKYAVPAIVFATTFSALTLWGCASVGSDLTTVVSEAQTIVNSLIVEAPLVSALEPNVLSATELAKLTNASKTGALDLASEALTTLQTQVAAGISDEAGAVTLNSVEADVNMAMSDLAPIMTIAGTVVPGLAQAIDVVKDVSLALPLVEDFINASIPSASVASTKLASARAAAVPTHGESVMTAQEALADLKLKTGK